MTLAPRVTSSTQGPSKFILLDLNEVTNKPALFTLFQ
jgi:hypothetical protein